MGSTEKEKIIAIAGQRRFPEMAKLVERHGGKAVHRSCQGSLLLQPEIMQKQMDELQEMSLDWFLFTTGVGTEAMLSAITREQSWWLWRRKLEACRLAARGYKTWNVLQQYGIHHFLKDTEGTTFSLMKALEGVDFRGATVAIQLYGDRAEQLIEWLLEEGARVVEFFPYRYTPPDPEVVQQLVMEIAERKIAAVAFTSAPQVHNLMQSAERLGCKQAVMEAFHQEVVAAAVGKLTAEAIFRHQIERCIFPQHERMGAMLVSLAKSLSVQPRTSLSASSSLPPSVI
ncbi:uroporphyrinogen-III synthase [Marinicrinis sediminis]|uniref:Uroporphyrinogen-III synthase n=1 Tax=Marinicrinis sediminis TaxID=1652465 RepID=A0ABW5R6G0_9BACL